MCWLHSGSPRAPGERRPRHRRLEAAGALVDHEDRRAIRVEDLHGEVEDLLEQRVDGVAGVGSLGGRQQLAHAQEDARVLLHALPGALARQLVDRRAGEAHVAHDRRRRSLRPGIPGEQDVAAPDDVPGRDVAAFDALAVDEGGEVRDHRAPPGDDQLGVAARQALVEHLDRVVPGAADGGRAVAEMEHALSDALGFRTRRDIGSV